MADKFRVPALQRAMAILEVLQKNKHCTMAELVNLTGIPRSSVYVLVEDMVKLKLLRQNSDKTVQLWIKLVSLGNSASESLDLKELVSPFLDNLLINIDCLAVHFGIMDYDKAYYAVKKTSPHSVMSISSREGAEINLATSALGRCLLAYQDSELREKIVSSIDYSKLPSFKMISSQSLRKDLATIHLRGYAYDNGEGRQEIRTLAVPVFDSDHHLLGAISIVGTISKFTSDKLSQIVDLTKECALDISKNLML